MWTLDVVLRTSQVRCLIGINDASARKKERERERDRQTDRQTDRESEGKESQGNQLYQHGFNIYIYIYIYICIYIYI